MKQEKMKNNYTVKKVNPLTISIVISLILFVLGLASTGYFYIKNKNDNAEAERRFYNWANSSKRELKSLFSELNASLQKKMTNDKDKNKAIIEETTPIYQKKVEAIISNFPSKKRWEQSTPINKKTINKEWKPTAPIDSSGRTKKWEPSEPISGQ